MDSVGWKAKWKNKDERQAYFEWRRSNHVIVKRLFTPKELLIFYLHFCLRLGCVKIKKRTGYTEHSLKKVIVKFREYSKYACISYENEISISQAYEEKIITPPNNEDSD